MHNIHKKYTFKNNTYMYIANKYIPKCIYRIYIYNKKRTLSF